MAVGVCVVGVVVVGGSGVTHAAQVVGVGVDGVAVVLERRRRRYWTILVPRL